MIDFYTGRRVDHNFDHLQDWTIWKQGAQEHLKASFADAKALEIIKKDIKNRPGALRDQEVVGSSPVASTTEKALKLKGFRAFFFYLFASILRLGQHLGQQKKNF